MVAIVFPVSSAPGQTPQEGSGRLVNCYAVKTEQGNRSPFKWQRSAGLRQLFNITGHSHFRGGIQVGSTFIACLDTRVYTITETAGVFTAVNEGALSGTDAVTIARNNAGTPQIVANCDAGLFNLFTSGAPTSFADGDMPALVCVTSADGYIVGLTGSGDVWATDLNAVTVDGSSFEPTEMEGRAVVWFRGELFIFGKTAFKVFEKTGATPFPFRNKKIDGTRGICGAHALAGADEGWIGELFWVGEDNIVYQLVGYTPTPVSNEDVTRAIAGSADRTLIEVSVYMDGQNAIVAVTSPDEWTWEFNKTTGLWNERESYGRDDWRGRKTIRAFDRWVAGDATTGLFSSIDPTYRYEYGDPLIMQIDSGDNAKFPQRLAVGPAYFDFVVGQGNAAGADPIETDPQAMLSFSLDGGVTYGNELTRSLGQQGQYRTQVSISRCGTTSDKGIRYRVRVSDPVISTFLGGQLPEVEVRAA